MKIGMVLEGGAMRGMYTCGVLDVMLENDINVDGFVGVSAGCVFGCNYKSKQIGRGIRYNKKYCKDPRYGKLRSLIKTGDIYDEQFCYHDIPEKLDPFDTETFINNPVEFYATCTDAKTGKAVYKKIKTGVGKDLRWMRASASMPFVSKVIKIDGMELVDGGISDSIPLKWFKSMGYEKNIVILTRPEGYVKKAMKFKWFLSKCMKKYPNAMKAMKNRHIMYNNELKEVEEAEKNGEILLIRPSKDLHISRTESDSDKLQLMYELGRSDALKKLEDMKKFVAVQP